MKAKILNKTVQHLQVYLKEFHPEMNECPLFYSLPDGRPHRLSTDSIILVLKSAADKARETCKAIEFDSQGNRRTQMFYCDANAPYQKGSCENNHEMIRRIIPKGTDLGTYTQNQFSLMMSHINSYARKSLGNKSPYEIFAFMYDEDLLKKFGLQFIPANDIILTPELLK